MVTKDKAKNVEYMKKSQAKKKEALGLTKYNRINADTEQKHRKKLKATMGIDEYKKQQAKYMKEYRAQQYELKREIGKKHISSNPLLTDAIRARKARAETNKLRDEKKVKNDVSSILNSIIDAVPVVSKNKKNREAVARHKELKALGETRIYNTKRNGRK